MSISGPRTLAALLLSLAVALAPGLVAVAAPVEACNPSPKTVSSLCLTSDVHIRKAGTTTPTTQSLAPVDVQVSFDNTSDDSYLAEPGQPRWLQSVQATLLSSSTVRPQIARSSALPDGLLFGGTAAGCGAGADLSYSGCTAGHGVAYAYSALGGFFCAPTPCKASFGIQRIQNIAGTTHYLEAKATLDMCVDTDGGAFNCGLTQTIEASVTLDPPASGPLVLNVPVPTVQNVNRVTIDSAVLRLKGQSNQKADGTSVPLQTMIRLPQQCGPVSAAAKATAVNGSTVTANRSVTVTGCTTLTANLSATQLTYGASGTLSGRLTDGGVAKANRTIRLRACPFGGACASRSTTTAADGSYSFAITPVRHTTYTVSDPDSYRSQVRTIKVAPKVTRAVSATTITSGGTVRISGSVAPSHAGRSVVVQRLVNGSWQGIASATLTSTSTYARTLTLSGAKGTKATVRVVIAAHDDHVAGISPLVQVTFG